MPRLKLGTLAPETAAQRRALTTVGDADIERARQFILSWTGVGHAPKPGGGVEEITAADAKKIALNIGVKFNVAKAAYTYQGALLDPSLIKAGTDVAFSNALGRIGKLVSQATSGEIDANALYSGTVQGIVDSYTATAGMAWGGLERIPDAARERIQSAALEQLEGRAQTVAQRGFPGLREIVKAATAGGYNNDVDALGSDLVRTMNGSRIVYENEYREMNLEAGREEVCRVLGGNANHCPSCLEIAAMGWRENNGEYPIGGDFCQDACYCIELFRKVGGAESPAVQKSIEYAKEKQEQWELIKAGRMKTDDG